MKQISVITDTEDVKKLLIKKLEEYKQSKVMLCGSCGIEIECINEKEIIAAISSVISESCCERIISKLINRNYFYLNLPERKIILKKAVRNAKGKNTALICEKLSEYLKDADNLVLRGFVDFRLGEYVDFLEKIVDMSADEFAVEREYEEFIMLLKAFADMQHSIYEIIHVVPAEGEYRLYDGNLRNITASCAADFFCSEMEDKMTSDDFLISMLISNSPEKIYIHKCNKIKNRDLINTICRVFEGKITKCDMCALCEE